MKFGNVEIVYTGTHKWIFDRLILVVRAGSMAYGTNIATSDVDVRGVFVPTCSSLFGFRNKVDQVDSDFVDATDSKLDCAIFDVRKFAALAAESNPNIIELLFTGGEDCLFVHPAIKNMLDNRNAFLSKKVKNSFCGYARGQLARIQLHRGYLLNPISEPPSREVFGLPPAKKAADKEQIKAAEYLNGVGYGYGSNFQALIDKEKKYKDLTSQWDKYQDWKKNRNPARAELEAGFGYDLKHGMHLARLLRMCLEIIQTGKVHVRRQDANELLEIRNGLWSYDRLIKWSEEQEARISEAFSRTSLPDQPNYDLIDSLCMETITSFIGK